MTMAVIRQRATVVVAALAVLMTIAVVASDRLLQGDLGTASALATAGLAALLISYVVDSRSSAFRYLAVAVMMAEVVALLIAAQGHPQQTDIHMVFFAALAVCALLYDWRAIVLGAALVAVHHLVLGMMLDELVFYGGGGLGRVMLHAVILTVETAGLVWMTLNTGQLLDLADERSTAAEASAREALALARQVEQASALRQDQVQTTTQLSTDFGRVVEVAVRGDFSARIETAYEDKALNALAQSINQLIGTVGGSIEETGRVLAHLAASDLTARMTGDYEGAFATLRDDANSFAARLESTMGSLRASIVSLRVASGEILSGTNDLAARTTRQAATVEKTTAAMEQLARTVLKTAERARDASADAAKVSQHADAGGLAMSQATSAMDKIKTSSANIANIIGLIDDIAFQTNLLALNASVEAARAGDAGKGFAVVAVEVRRLAQSAAQASSEIKTLIEMSTREVGSGTRLVEEASAKLDAVLGAAKASSSLIDGIAQDSRDQASAIEEITVAVRQIDEMIQHNAALVEQTNAAIEQSESQTSDIEQAVSAFRTADSQSAAVSSRHMASAA